jgi:hypothetical protein
MSNQQDQIGSAARLLEQAAGPCGALANYAAMADALAAFCRKLNEEEALAVSLAKSLVAQTGIGVSASAMALEESYCRAMESSLGIGNVADSLRRYMDDAAAVATRLAVSPARIEDAVRVPSIHDLTRRWRMPDVTPRERPIVPQKQKRKIGFD